jgi:tetratricopeptide (TPR) repeat protein
MGWWTWLLYLLSNWYFWPFLGGILYAVAWPFIKAVRLWQIKRRFIRSQGAKLLNPQNADARFQLANIYAEGGSWTKARQYAQAAVKVAEENPLYEGQVPYHFLKLLGEASLRKGDVDASVQAFERALTAKSDLGHSEALFGLGKALYRKGDLAKSFDTLNKAIEDNSSNLEGYFRMAQAAMELGRPSHADQVKKEFWRVAASLPAFAGRHRFRWRLAFALFPITRYFV